jgi:SAM-dependent methyltransferase
MTLTNTAKPSLGAAAAAAAQTACRGCGRLGLELILSLGRTPLANSLLTAEQLSRLSESSTEPTYPLDTAFCPACSLVQITDTVPPEQLFSEYLYFSSFSDTMLRHAEAAAGKLVRERKLGPNSLVAEIASNDGYLLQYFVRAGVPVLGIEPARNIAKVARERGVNTVCEFFGRELAAKLAAEGKRADVILANNVMAHVPDINSVLTGIKAMLKPGGVFVMETPYLKDLLDKLEFDTIYHEHVFYYSLTALENLFRRHGLAAADVEHLPIHGGSLRVTAAHAGEEGDRPRVRAVLAEEAGWGVSRPDAYREFADRVGALRGKLTALLRDLKTQGYRLAAYGASAKGSTLLNAFGIGRDLLDFVVDRSTYKQGRFTPGTHLPIHAPEKLLEARPDYVLLLTWNFADEILVQQAEYRRAGGKFILPVPEPKVV